MDKAEDSTVVRTGEFWSPISTIIFKLTVLTLTQILKNSPGGNANTIYEQILSLSFSAKSFLGGCIFSRIENRQNKVTHNLHSLSQVFVLYYPQNQCKTAVIIMIKT